MKNSKRLFTLLILFVSILIFSMLTVSAAVVSTVQTDTLTDKIIQIDAKYKQVPTNKVSWNGNGGKIGSKTTISKNIKKGAKIGKLPSTPKRTGYKFTGWYTKKTGGTKISVNTKPSNSVTYFARWTKNSFKSKLIGPWTYFGAGYTTSNQYSYNYHFYENGSFKYFYQRGSLLTYTEGKYKDTGGKIYFSNIQYMAGTQFEEHFNDTVFEYRIGKDTMGEYLFISSFKYNVSYVDITNWGVKFRPAKKRDLIFKKIFYFYSEYSAVHQL